MDERCGGVFEDIDQVLPVAWQPLHPRAFARAVKPRLLLSAVLVTIASAFIGFTTYRLAHPANFSVCYSPWILWAWTRLLDARAGRQEVLALVARGLSIVGNTAASFGTVSCSATRSRCCSPS